MEHKNSAIRVYEVLTFLNTQAKSNKKLKGSFFELFDTDSNFVIYSRLRLLNLEIDKIEDNLNKRNLTDQLYTDAIKEARKSLNIDCLDKHFNTVHIGHLSILKVCSDLLFNGRDEIDVEFIEKIKVHLSDLRALVVDIDDEFVQEILFEILEELEELLKIYSFFGPEYIKNNTAIITGKIFFIHKKIDDKVKEKLKNIIFDCTQFAYKHQNILLEAFEKLAL
jgi:hypothetical protein